MVLTRQRVRVVLGALWILDGLLQLQRSMFTVTFAHTVIAPAGQGQPWFVAEPVALTAGLIAAHPAAWNAAFAVIQLSLGVGFMVPRLVRPALLASVAWAAGVWWLGEGLGGLAGGHADLLTGAPGAVLLYAVLAVAVWPRADATGVEHLPLPGLLTFAWAGLWIGGAVFRLLPGQASSAAIAAEIDASAAGTPGWLHQIDATASALVAPAGTGLVVAWVVVCLMVGLGGLGRGAVRQTACAVGIVIATTFWFVGQSLGQPWSGTATDPNSGPLIVLMALAVMAVGGPAPIYGRHRKLTAVGARRVGSRGPGSSPSAFPVTDVFSPPVAAWAAPELWAGRQPVHREVGVPGGWRAVDDEAGVVRADEPELAPAAR